LNQAVDLHKVPNSCRWESFSAGSDIPLIETNGQQTNFGPLFWEAKSALDRLFKRHCLPCSTGTSALQLACQVAFERGSRIAVPDFTMVASLHAVVAAGCVPVIVPCDQHTGMMCKRTLDSLASWGVVTGAVVVSPFGAAFDHTTYEQTSLRIVYDLAGAFPMEVATRSPCSYSTHATKNISTREGGFVTFATQEEFERARKLSCFALDGDRVALSIHAGNHKMDEYRCRELLEAVTNGLEGIHARIRNKRRLVRFYAGRYAIPLSGLTDGFPSLCVLKVPDAKRLEDFGAKRGITFKRYYHPLLSKMAFQEKVQVGSSSHSSLQQFVAFPSDATDEQAERVRSTAEEAFR